MVEAIIWWAYRKVYERVLNRLYPRNRMLEVAMQELDIKSNHRYLDAGCGSGETSHRLSLRGGEITGLDISDFFLKRARVKYPEVRFVKADLDGQLPFADGSFDGIISINTVYLLKKYKNEGGRSVLLALTEFARILKPQADLVLVTPVYPGYSITAIAKDHFQMAIREKGFMAACYEFIRYSPHIMVVSIANLYIKAMGKKGVYNFFKESEFVKDLQILGFEVLHTEKVYSGQNILIHARKRY